MFIGIVVLSEANFGEFLASVVTSPIDDTLAIILYLLLFLTYIAIPCAILCAIPHGIYYTMHYTIHYATTSCKREREGRKNNTIKV
jgi:hypothetical protein